jgi:hypothetical protein
VVLGFLHSPFPRTRCNFVDNEEANTKGFKTITSSVDFSCFFFRLLTRRFLLKQKLQQAKLLRIHFFCFRGRGCPLSISINRLIIIIKTRFAVVHATTKRNHQLSVLSLQRPHCDWLTEVHISTLRLIALESIFESNFFASNHNYQFSVYKQKSNFCSVLERAEGKTRVVRP